MTSTSESSDQRPEQGSDVPDFYAALTDRIADYTAGMLAFHMGLCGPDTFEPFDASSLRDSLLRANSALVQGCEFTHAQRVLDAGCGLGGTAIWLAQTYGVRVVGLTNCEPHIELAAEYAEQKGVGHLIEFHHGDFMRLPYPDASFDAVLNHETFGYATDKLAYLRGVHRILKPGGRWQMLDGFLNGPIQNEYHEKIHAAVYRGFHMPPWVEWRDMPALLEAAGFEGVDVRDLTSEVAPFAAQQKNQMLLRYLLFNPRGESKAHREFDDATVNFDMGLKEGILTYFFMSGVKPTLAR